MATKIKHTETAVPADIMEILAAAWAMTERPRGDPRRVQQVKARNTALLAALESNEAGVRRLAQVGDMLAVLCDRRPAA